MIYKVVLKGGYVTVPYELNTSMSRFSRQIVGYITIFMLSGYLVLKNHGTDTWQEISQSDKSNRCLCQSSQKGKSSASA